MSVDYSDQDLTDPHVAHGCEQPGDVAQRRRGHDSGGLAGRRGQGVRLRSARVNQHLKKLQDNLVDPRRGCA
uniref:Truncated orfX near bldB n=1 Tax=Streptomyces coelicolor TaxID=1902 RepID=Q53864_STRCH|nr:orfX; near the bldB gene [Streptomyces coelicolor]